MRRAFLLFSLFSCFVPAARADVVAVDPEPGLFEFRAGLAGQHPRLHFTAADIPDIRARAKGPASFFYERAVAAFGHYDGQAVDDAGANAWKAYLFGFWGQFTMNLMHLVEEEDSYADTAIDWALTYARRDDWLADDLIPMDIVSGMALTYDILYDRLSEAERVELRTALFAALEFMHDEFFVAEYWTQDYQNNHMHNRIHGFAHAALAILGDDPQNAPAGRHADLAYACFLGLLPWLPEDGSNHEGPGYWSYGHHWLVRTVALFRHCSGRNDTAGHAHFAEAHWFRIHLSTPGWQGSFNIGDGGDGSASNLTPMALGIADAGDAAAQTAMLAFMDTLPGAFYQHPAWGVLWHDAELAPAPLADLPLWRFWPDLEMLASRTGWGQDDSAFVFKCGPPGGHLMQQLRGSSWVNVAHDHPDQNHFLLWAHGTMLAEDDGYPKEQKLTRSHNTITVDGAGQTREGAAWYQPFDYALTGRLLDVFLSGKSAMASGDASLLYEGADRVHRHVLWMEGEFLVVLDDLLGAGADEHVFEWRLHKDGLWSEQAPGHFRVDDGEAALDIQFLEPQPNALNAEFLPAELTAAPCLAVSTQATQASFLSLLTPQESGAPNLQFEALNASPSGQAVRVNGPQGVTRAAWSLGAQTVSFDGVEMRAATAALRENLSLMVRGTSLIVDGQPWLTAEVPCNLARRDSADRTRLEAEAAYGAGGGLTEITLGGLQADARYTLEPSGQNLSSDAAGQLRLELDLADRKEVELVFAGLIETDGGISDAGRPDAGMTDAGLADAGRPDAGMADAGLSDAGAEDDDQDSAGRVEGSCGCANAAPEAAALWLLSAGLILLRRRGRIS